MLIIPVMVIYCIFKSITVLIWFEDELISSIMIIDENMAKALIGVHDDTYTIKSIYFFLYTKCKHLLIILFNG